MSFLAVGGRVWVFCLVRAELGGVFHALIGLWEGALWLTFGR